METPLVPVGASLVQFPRRAFSRIALLRPNAPQRAALDADKKRLRRSRRAAGFVHSGQTLLPSFHPSFTGLSD